MGIHYDRGQALFSLERYADSIAEYQQELAVNPQCAASKANIAAALVNLKRYFEAKQTAREVLGMAPDYSYAHYVLSFVESNDGHDSPALRAVGEALRIQPTARYLCRRGWLLRAQGRHAECLDAIGEALALDARHQEALVLRARTLDALGRHDEAAETLRSALAINPENPDAHQALGAVTLAYGDPAEALDALREARRISPVEHHDRDRILDAYARRMRPFRGIDLLIKRLGRWSPVRRWLMDAAIFTPLLGVLLMTHPEPGRASAFATALMIFVCNALVFLYKARHYPAILIRFRRRRELGLRWRDVVRANFRNALKLFFAHFAATILGVWLSLGTGFAFFVFAATMYVRRLNEKHSVFGNEAGILLFFPLAGALILGILFTHFVKELEAAPAIACWVAVLAVTGLAAVVVQWLNRRRGRSASGSEKP